MTMQSTYLPPINEHHGSLTYSNQIASPLMSGHDLYYIYDFTIFDVSIEYLGVVRLISSVNINQINILG